MSNKARPGQRQLCFARLPNSVVATGGTDRSVRFYQDQQPSKVLESITGIHQGPINCMTAVGGLLITGSSDCSTRAFNDGKLICSFKQDSSVTHL